MKEKLLMAAASLLGFATACDQNRNLVEYGSPYMNYKVKGKVTDKEGHPIPGIAVKAYYDQKTITDNDGSYDLTGEGGPQTIDITFTDTDGPANGGEFAEKRIQVEFTEADRTAKGDKNWYSGEFSRSDVDATLEEKE